MNGFYIDLQKLITGKDLLPLDCVIIFFIYKKTIYYKNNN